MESLRERYERLCREPSDINEHLPVLREYAARCDSIAEFGVRGGNSTTALLSAWPRRMTSIDLHPCPVAELLAGMAPWIDFRFIQADTREPRPRYPCELLFIDTLHTYAQLSEELQFHAAPTRRYILLHDTTTFGDVGEDGGLGLWPAVEEFLAASGGRWRLLERLTNQNGLTVLGRIQR